MRVPHSLIVPDSKPPLLLMGLGATLLAGVILRALRRRQARTTPARDTVVNSTGRTVRQSSSTRAKPRTQALLASSLEATPRVKTARVPVGERS